MFTCETVGGALTWIVNGTQRDVHSAEIRNDLIISEISTEGGSKHETLTIPARAEYNVTTVQCAVLTFGGSALSDNVTMTIQGVYVAYYRAHSHVMLGVCFYRGILYVFLSIYCQLTHSKT